MNPSDAAGIVFEEQDDFAAGMRALEHQDAAARARGFITGFTISRYLLEHPQPGRHYLPNQHRFDAPASPEFLATDAEHLAWYVRWPNGACKWESRAGLASRGFTTPTQPLLGILEGTHA